jgi:hypothetical protein
LEPPVRLPWVVELQHFCKARQNHLHENGSGGWENAFENEMFLTFFF